MGSANVLYFNNNNNNNKKKKKKNKNNNNTLTLQILILKSIIFKTQSVPRSKHSPSRLYKPVT